MKFCPVVPEICRGQVHGARKERRITRTKRIIIIIIIIRNGAKTISLQTLFGRLNNNNKKRSKNNKSPKRCLGDLITRVELKLTNLYNTLSKEDYILYMTSRYLFCSSFTNVTSFSVIAHSADNVFFSRNVDRTVGNIECMSLEMRI